jgi:hypothetical protein
MPLKCFGKPTSQSLSDNGAVHPDRPAHPNNRQNQSVDISFSTVDIAPNRAVTRSGMGWHGMGVELVQSMTHERVDHSFHSPLHLLAHTSMASVAMANPASGVCHGRQQTIIIPGQNKDRGHAVSIK